MLHLIERNWLASPISKSELLKISICEHWALEDLRLGRATELDWHTLRDAAALAETMALGGVGPEAAAPAAAALASLTNQTLNDSDVASINEMLAYHDEQRKVVNRSELFVWLKKTVERFNEAT